MTTRLQRWQEKPRGTKTKTYFNKASKWLRTIIVTDQDNVSVFEFALIVRRYYNVCFHTICADVVYPPRKIHSYLLIFPPIKDFLDVYNLAHPSQLYTDLKFPKY